MEKKNRTILTVLWVSTLFITLVGATLAYYSAVHKSKPQVITTSSLSLSVTTKGSMHVENIKPTTWTSVASAANNTDISKIPFTVTAPAGAKAIYDINLSTSIPINPELSGGSVSDIKYKLFKTGEKTPLKEGSLSANFSEDIIVDSPINEGEVLNDSYMLYIYIENRQAEQNMLQDIDSSIKITGSADQID